MGRADAVQALALTANGGAITADTVMAGGSLDVAGHDTVTFANAVGNAISIASTDGAIVITNDLHSTSSSSDVELSGGAIDIADVNDVRITQLQASDGDIDINAVDDMRLGLAEAAGNITLASSAGTVAVDDGRSGVVFVGTGLGSPGPGDIVIDAALDASGSFDARRDLLVNAGRDILLADSTAGRDIQLSSGGMIGIGGAVAAGNDVAADSQGNLEILNASASLAGQSNLRISAGDQFVAQGVVSGASIDITASDVTIGAGGGIGDASVTGSISFTNRGPQVVLGGGNTAGAFSIDNDEFSRIHSGGDISIAALATALGDPGLVINDLDVEVGTGSGASDDGNISSSGALLLVADGGVRIDGDVGIRNAGPGNRLLIDAGGLVRLDSESGNVRIEDAGGDIAGRIDIFGRQVVAASDAAAADIDGLTVAQIDIRLAENDGVLRDDGFFQAADLEFRVDEAVYIQNSGSNTANDARRGFRSDTLTIVGRTAGDVGIVVNGVIGGATGSDAIGPAAINAGFDAGSTINGCLIANPAICVGLGVGPSPVGPIQDLIEQEITPKRDDQSVLTMSYDPTLIQIKDPSEYGEDPLIDDPITGAGNEDLWTTGGP